jgi:hypothetical protein
MIAKKKEIHSRDKFTASLWQVRIDHSRTLPIIDENIQGSVQLLGACCPFNFKLRQRVQAQEPSDTS